MAAKARNGMPLLMAMILEDSARSKLMASPSLLLTQGDQMIRVPPNALLQLEKKLEHQTLAHSRNLGVGVIDQTMGTVHDLWHPSRLRGHASQDTGFRSVRVNHMRFDVPKQTSHDLQSSPIPHWRGRTTHLFDHMDTIFGQVSPNFIPERTLRTRLRPGHQMDLKTFRLHAGDQVEQHLLSTAGHHARDHKADHPSTQTASSSSSSWMRRIKSRLPPHAFHHRPSPQSSPSRSPAG